MQTPIIRSIGQTLSGIGAKTGNLLRQAGGLPPVHAPKPSGYVGSTRRLTPVERADVVSMLKRDDLYTAQEIASKHRISRAAVYLIKDSEGLTQHTRRPTVHA